MKTGSIIRIAGIAIVAVIAIAVSFFVTGSDDVATYNDKMVDGIQAMDTAFEGFLTELYKYYKSEEVDIAFLENELQVIDGKYKETEALVGSIKVPKDELVQEFHAKVKAYMENSGEYAKVCENSFAYMKEHNPPAYEDAEAVLQMYAEIEAEAGVLWDEMLAAQEKMAEKFNIELQ